MDFSICIATYNKPYHLSKVLKSIERQSIKVPFECIVVDDGSETRALNASICEKYDWCRYYYIHRPGYIGPAIPRNISYKLASGRILVLQSDDVIHKTPDLLEKLLPCVNEKQFSLATVFKTYRLRSKMRNLKTSPLKIAQIGNKNVFFLGAVLRKHVYDIGGNDERFTTLMHEDTWFSDCLMKGLGLQPYYPDDCVGIHLWHKKGFKSPADYEYQKRTSKAFYLELVKSANYGTPTAKWPYIDGQPLAKSVQMDGQCIP